MADTVQQRLDKLTEIKYLCQVLIEQEYHELLIRLDERTQQILEQTTKTNGLQADPMQPE